MSVVIACEIGQRGGNRRESVEPALAAMARHQNSRRLAAPDPSGWQLRSAIEQCVYARITRDVNIARNLLGAKILRREICGREQDLGVSIDRRPIFLLRPGKRSIMRAEPGFDVRYGHATSESRKCGPKGARGVALDDQEVGTILEARRKSLGHGADMCVRIFLSGAVEIDPLKAIQSELDWVQS